MIGGGCSITCDVPNPCYIDGVQANGPICTNTDGTEATCLNNANCEGLSTVDPNNPGSCVVTCVPDPLDPCFHDGNPAGQPWCPATADDAGVTCNNKVPACEGTSTWEEDGTGLCDIECVCSDPNNISKTCEECDAHNGALSLSFVVDTTGSMDTPEKKAITGFVYHSKRGSLVMGQGDLFETGKTALQGLLVRLMMRL